MVPFLLMKARREITTTMLKIVLSIVKEIWKQRRSAGTKVMKLVEEDARAHIHSDVK